MFSMYKLKKQDRKELYPGVPTTDGTNDFLDLYSKRPKEELLKTLSIFKQQVVEKALELTLTSHNTYKYSILIEDITALSYGIKSIEILLRINK